MIGQAWLDANSILGEIQGTGTGGVEFVSAGADFAGWLPRFEAAERIEPGDVVGLHGGALSKRTDGAARVFVVSTAPIVTSNDPGEEVHGAYARVAFVGQAPVKVRGPVRAGDLLVASGRGDGSAVARAPNAVSSNQSGLIVGRALEASSESGTHLVRALIGLDAAATIALERDLARLERRVRELEAHSSSSERPTRDEAPPTRRR